MRRRAINPVAKLRCPVWAIAAALSVSAVSSAQVSVTYIDQIGDQKLRRFDVGADDPINPSSVLPDLSAVHIAGWAPSGPGLSAFTGQQVEVRDADVVKIEVIFEGLLNPPGPLGLGLTAFDPYRYGPSPVYGFVDFDADEDKDTGGELTLPAQLRYLANVARFGHIPDNSIGERAATRGKQVDGSYQSQPFYERSGADFAIALCGCWDVEIIDEGLNPNGIFEAGETWFIRGRFFERARGYAGASSVVGGSGGGQYDPETTVRWWHDIASNRTVLTLVEALNMSGAATLRGEPQQSPDFSLFNHTSVEEAVADLIFNYNSGSGLTAILIEDWEGREPEDALRATRWETTVLIGTSHTSPLGTLYAWTDTGFEETPGDVNGNGSANAQDEDDLRAFVYANDGGPDDEDGVKNGVFDIKNFGPNFVIFDLDYNGLVEGEDLWLYGHRADLDDNGLLNLFDILIFQDLFVNGDLSADFDLNQRLEIFDFLAFQDALSR